MKLVGLNDLLIGCAHRDRNTVISQCSDQSGAWALHAVRIDKWRSVKLGVLQRSAACFSGGSVLLPKPRQSSKVVCLLVALTLRTDAGPPLVVQFPAYRLDSASLGSLCRKVFTATTTEFPSRHAWARLSQSSYNQQQEKRQPFTCINISERSWSATCSKGFSLPLAGSVTWVLLSRSLYKPHHLLGREFCCLPGVARPVSSAEGAPILPRIHST